MDKEFVTRTLISTVEDLARTAEHFERLRIQVAALAKEAGVEMPAIEPQSA